MPYHFLKPQHCGAGDPLAKDAESAAFAGRRAVSRLMTEVAAYNAPAGAAGPPQGKKSNRQRQPWKRNRASPT